MQDGNDHVIDPELTESVGCAGSLEYKVPYNAPLYDEYEPRVTLASVYENDLLIWKGRLLTAERDFFGNKSLTFEGELAYLNDIVYPPYNFSGDIPDFMAEVVGYYNSKCSEGRQMQIGSITVTDPNHYIHRSSGGYASCWEVLNEKLCKSLGGYLRLRYDDDGNRILDYLADPGLQNMQTIEFGRNLLDLEHYINAEEIATVIIPIGAEIEGTDERVTIDKASNNPTGLNYIETPFVSQYGRIEAVVEWEDVTVPENLYTKAQEYASAMAMQDVSIEARVVDLHLVDQEVDSLKVGDHVRCISVPHNLSVELMLSSRTRNLNDPSQDSITLGSEMQTFSEHMSDNFREVEEEQEKQKIYNADLAHRIETAKGMYTTVETKEDGSQVIMMHDKPTLGESQLIMNISDVGFHMSGDAGATWYGLDFSGEFLAKYIETYKLSADHIYGGTLSSKAIDDKTGQPVTYIDMDSGEVAKLGNIGWIKRSSGNESLKWMGEVPTNGN